MNKAFEKILVRLKEEKRKRVKCIANGEPEKIKSMNEFNMLQDVIKIIQEVAEEYTSTEHINCSTNTSTDTSTNGWIPCSERLPEEGKDVLVWFEYFRYGNYNRLFQTMGISYVYNGKWSGFVNNSSGWSQLRIIAWQPLPEPFKECD